MRGVTIRRRVCSGETMNRLARLFGPWVHELDRATLRAREDYFRLALELGYGGRR